MNGREVRWERAKLRNNCAELRGVETHIMSEMIPQTIPDRNCRSLPRI